jgi:hypothetical protein
LPTVPEADNQPSSSAFPLAEDATFPDTAMILRVSPYAGECRFVRVTLVLIFARAPDLCCLCVTSAGRSSPGQPTRLRPGPACRPQPEDRPRRPPKWPATHPATPSQAGNYASRRLERASMDQTTHNADSGRTKVGHPHRIRALQITRFGAPCWRVGIWATIGSSLWNRPFNAALCRCIFTEAVILVQAGPGGPLAPPDLDGTVGRQPGLPLPPAA